MKKIALVASSAAFALGALVLALPALADVTNGSFETGTDPGSYLTVNAGSTDITNWTVDSGSVDYVGSYWQSSDGLRSIDLNGLAQGSLSQSFPTTIGTTYNATFDLSGNPDSRPAEDSLWSPSDKVVQVTATGGSPQTFDFDTAVQGNSLGAMKWMPETYSFTANSTNTTLTFASQIPGAFGPALDHVVVSAATPVCNLADNTTFDPFALGSVNGQFGWSATGPYDQAVVANTYGYTTFGCKSLRLSNAVTSGAFGDQTFSYGTPVAAGESTVAPNNHFEAQFDIASTQLDQQPGLALSVSPDNGSGARMSYLRFEDQADGIHVFFDDVQQPSACTPSGCANFVETQLPTLSRTQPHTIKFVMDFLDGPGNDIVKIYIDGSLVHTGGSWEDYYRYDPEQAGGGNQLSPVSKLIFRAGGTAAPATSGKGYLFDNVELSSSYVAAAPAAQCPDGTTMSASPVGTVTINSNNPTPVASIASLANGALYLLKASGTYHSSLNDADAEYTTVDNWATHMNGYDISPYMLGEGEFDLQINNGFVDWGAYNPSHQYAYLFTGAGAPVNLGIFDGDSNTNTKNAGWYGDNSGSLSVDIYKCEPNTPPTPPAPPANACATPNSAPDGYTLVKGTSKNEQVTLTDKEMYVDPGGNNTITGGNGSYIVCTAGGNDTITLGNATYTIDAGGGNNTIKTGDGAGAITTGSGNDKIIVGTGAHTINAGNGNNTVTTGDGDQNVTTGSGNDNITTGAGNDTVDAGGGNNTVSTDGGDDGITAGSGNDHVNAGTGSNTCSLGGGINIKSGC